MSELKPVTNDQIRKIALSNGFKLKTQPHGGEGLNPYVYNFAQALLDQAIPEGYALVPIDVLEHSAKMSELLEVFSKMVMPSAGHLYRNCDKAALLLDNGPVLKHKEQVETLNQLIDKAGVLGL